MLPSRPEIRRKGIVLLICLPFAAVHLGAVDSSRAESQAALQPAIGAGLKTTESRKVDARADPFQNAVRTATAGTEEPSVRSEPTLTAEPLNSLSSGQTGSVPPETPPSEQGPAPETTPPGPTDQEQQTVVDVVHDSVSRGIQESATWMDSFFGDRRYESELNESYIRFRYEVFKEEESDVSIPKPDVQIRIILPQLQRKTRLVLSGTQKERTDFSVFGSDPENAALTGSEDRDINVGLQQTLLETLKDNLSVRVGVRLHDNKPLLVFGPRYRTLLPLDSWQLRFIEEVFWTNQDGWVSTTTFDAERELARDFFFRATNTWSWVEDTAGLLYDVSFGIRQPIDDNRALGYEWVNLFRTRPVHELYETALRVRYRQQLWREWAFFEIAPQYRFPRSNSFRGLAGVLFRLEMIFGDYR